MLGVKNRGGEYCFVFEFARWRDMEVKDVHE
jgi:hypothetical protein